jgi:hypothetical protein
MDGLAARSLLLGSLVIGAAICIGSIATAQYLASTRNVAHREALVAKSSEALRRPAAAGLDDVMETGAIVPLRRGEVQPAPAAPAGR